MERLKTSPIWHCLHLDLRRHWCGRRLALLIAMLVGVLALQAAISYVWFTNGTAIVRTTGTPGQWGLLIANNLGLVSPLWAWDAVSRTFVPGLPTNSMWTVPWMAFSAVSLLLFLFIMPAVLAASIAPEREAGRLNPLVLTGMKPGQILLAKGLAAAAPFLALVVVNFTVETVRFLLVSLPMQNHPSIVPELYQEMMRQTASLGEYASFAQIGRMLAMPWVYLAQMGILVCISALCRRTSLALLVCYGEALLRSVAMGILLPQLVLLLVPGEPVVRNVLTTLLLLIIHVGILALLLPPALRSLSFPDEPPVELEQLPSQRLSSGGKMIVT